MPRRARIDAPGALHHIIVRGIERGVIFQDDKDRDEFLRRLGALLTETNTFCYAWALIPNHFHLLLRSGAVPISTFMSRLLTGYAVGYNRRYNRNGQLFQNRYKSILCQAEPYLLELVGYIHLNPLRAGLVKNIEDLESYAYAGHSTLMGRRWHQWQDTAFVLAHFGKDSVSSRERYREYLAQGAGMERRADLTGGGLIRSPGGWKPARDATGSGPRVKGDERILGTSAFVDRVLRERNEKINRQHLLKSQGLDLKKIEHRVAVVMDAEEDVVFQIGRNPRLVEARSVFCYWAVRELGSSATEISKELNLTQPAVSIAVKRGERIVKERGYELSQH